MDGIPGATYEWQLLYNELRTLSFWGKIQTLLLGAIAGAVGVNVIMPGVG